MKINRIFRNLTEQEKISAILFIAVWLVYMVISMTKSAYAATMASIISEKIFDKTQAGTINACFYVFYGGAQLLGFRLIDKISPMKFVSITIVGTLLSIIGMAVSKRFVMMLVCWSFCGLVQFAVWPAVLRIIAEYLEPSQKEKAMVYIAFSYCVGMLANYIIAGVVLSVAHWRAVFWVTAVILSLTLALWQAAVIKYKEGYTHQYEINKKALCEKNKNKQSEGTVWGKQSFLKLIAVSGLIIMLLPSFIRTILDLGVKSWVPTMITEYYDVSPGFASMLTSVLVFINLGGIYIANWMYPKKIKNTVVAYGMCFLIALPLMVVLLWMGKIPLVVSVILLSGITTLMYSGHQFINVIIPAFFAKYNKTGSVAALLNAFASFGAVAANFGLGYIAEHYGWNGTIIIWIILATISFVLCMAAVPLWERFTNFKGEIKNEKTGIRF